MTRLLRSFWPAILNRGQEVASDVPDSGQDRNLRRAVERHRLRTTSLTRYLRRRPPAWH